MDGQTAAFSLVIVIIAVALIFDYVNGFHDAANSIATVVATRVLSPGVAVAWAAFFNFIAFLVFGTAVAKTIGGDLVDIAKIPGNDQLFVLLAAVTARASTGLLNGDLSVAKPPCGVCVQRQKCRDRLATARAWEFRIKQKGPGFSKAFLRL